MILNGHEYVAAQAQKAGIRFSKQENCFTAVNHAAELAKIADTLSQKETAGRLRQLCERSDLQHVPVFCAGPRRTAKEHVFRYQYSVFQLEYSRNLLFRSGRQMEEIFQSLIDRTRAPLDLDRIKTIFGDKYRPHYDKRKKNPTRWGVVVETPTYDLTVFKVHYGKMTLKIYTKGARVLRVEVIVHDARSTVGAGHCHALGKSFTRLHNILQRFLNAVGCMDACFVADDTLENLPFPTQVGQTKVGGIDFNKPRMRQVAEAVLALATWSVGFTGFRAGAKGSRHERPSRTRLWAAARRLRHQETAGQRHGSQNRQLASLRSNSGRPTGNNRAAGPTGKSHQTFARRQSTVPIAVQS